MKQQIIKIITILMLLAPFSSAFAEGDTEESIQFGYCEGKCSGIGGINPNHYICGAIELPANVTEIFSGNHISAVNIHYGYGKAKDITLFLTYDLKNEPFYTQEYTISKIRNWNKITLNTPYEFENKKVYIGYYVRVKSGTDYPISSDDSPNQSIHGDYLGYGSTVEIMRENMGHNEGMGNIGIQAIITGNKLPQYNARPFQLTLPPYTAPEKEFDATVSISNVGVKPINNLEFICTVGDNVPTSKKVVIEQPILSNESGKVIIPGLISNTQDKQVLTQISINKVNDTENPMQNESVHSSLVCLPYVFSRALVVEEATGLWCGYCPLGYVGMEHMRDTYTDGSFIGIAVHQGDIMESKSYADFIDAYITDYPSAILNRKYSVNPDKEILESAYARERSLALAKVDLVAKYSDDTKTHVNLITNTEFVTKEDDIDYGLSFVITEDNVGPYMQSNNFAGGSLGEMGGFEDMEGKVSLIFNDVARDIYGWEGIEGSIPSSVTPGEKYTFEHTMSLENVKDQSKMSFIALLIDRKTKEIINATRTKTDNGSAIVPINGNESSLSITVDKGSINVTGKYECAQIYDIYGNLVGSISGENPIGVPAGIYIIKVTTDSTTIVKKINVK